MVPIASLQRISSYSPSLGDSILPDCLQVLIARIKQFIASYILTPLYRYLEIERATKIWKWDVFDNLRFDESSARSALALVTLDQQLVNQNYCDYLSKEFKKGSCYGQALAVLKYASNFNTWENPPLAIHSSLRTHAIFFHAAQIIDQKFQILLFLSKHLEKSGETLDKFIFANQAMSGNMSVDQNSFIAGVKEAFPYHNPEELEIWAKIITVTDLKSSSAELTRLSTQVHTAVRNTLQKPTPSDPPLKTYSIPFMCKCAHPSASREKVEKFLASKQGRYTLSMNATGIGGHRVFLSLAPQKSSVFDPYDQRLRLYDDPNVCIEETLDRFERQLPSKSNWWTVDELTDQPPTATS